MLRLFALVSLAAGCTIQLVEQDPGAVGACGDGVVDSGEECDDGNTVHNDACRNDCRLPACGDGLLTQPPEQCDDGNHTSGDGCTFDCLYEHGECGNEIVEPFEVCDDGNTVAGDGCSANCLSQEVCGNAIVDLAEECDDGGESAVCDADCTIAVCGDDHVNGLAGEECEPGHPTSGPFCASDCTNSLCGDGVVNTAGGEECDDGNTVSGDGCAANCVLE